MQLFTVSADLGINRGMRLNIGYKPQVTLGGGSLSRWARPDRYALPEIDENVVHNAYPLFRGKHIFLTRDRQPHREAVLVLVKPRMIGRHLAIGSLRLELSSPGVEEIARVTGPRDYYRLQDGIWNVGWVDSLVVMWPGDFIVVLTEDGRELRAQYGETGLRLVEAVQPRLHA